MTRDAVATSIACIRNGGIVAVVDDGLAQPDVDLVAAGENLEARTLRRLRDLGNGEVYAPAATRRLNELGLSEQPPAPGDPLARRPALAASVGLADASAALDDEETAAVVRALASDRNGADFRSPGPVTPIRAREGGVLRRLGHTEAAVDLAVLAGFAPVAVLAHVDTPDPAVFEQPSLTTDPGDRPSRWCASARSSTTGGPTSGWCTAWLPRNCRRRMARSRPSLFTTPQPAKTTWR